MVYAMHEEVQCDSSGVVGEQLVDVEQEAVEDVFQDGPHEVSEEEAQHRLHNGRNGNVYHHEELQRRGRVLGEEGQGVVPEGKLHERAYENVTRDGQPERGHDIPRRSSKHLEEVGTEEAG